MILYMCLLIITEVHLYSQTLTILLTISLVICPILYFIDICCNLWLFNECLRLLFCNFGVFPNHKFNLRAMGKSYDVFDWPVYAEDGLFVLFLPQCFAGLAFPNYDESWLITTCQVSSIWANRKAYYRTLMSYIRDIQWSWKRSQCWGIW